MKTFLGFEYWDGENTTTGNPHPQTGRMSTAGDLKIFNSDSARQEWVNSGSKKRISVTLKQAKNLHAGWSHEDFNYNIECMKTLLENEE